MTEEKPPSRTQAIFTGFALLGVGALILAVSFFADGKGFHAPRWVVACVGGACLLFGAMAIATYTAGFDPERPAQPHLPPRAQLAFFAPAMLFFAAPFNWVAFGPGPRHFKMSLPIPFWVPSPAANEILGRVAFGFGALMIDAIFLAGVIGLLRHKRQEQRPGEIGGSA